MFLHVQYIYDGTPGLVAIVTFRKSLICEEVEIEVDLVYPPQIRKSS